MKKRMKDLGEQERIRTLDALYTAASVLKGRAATKQFLKGLLTESERVMLGRRVLIARLLLSGETRRGICERLGSSQRTVASVKRWLSEELPGYEEAIVAMEEEFEKRDFKKQYATSTLFRLKKRYPLHFLLFPNPK